MPATSGIFLTYVRTVVIMMVKCALAAFAAYKKGSEAAESSGRPLAHPAARGFHSEQLLKRHRSSVITWTEVFSQSRRSIFTEQVCLPSTSSRQT